MNLHTHPNAPPDVSRLDLYSAAFLTGGPARVADVAVLAMRATGVLHVGRDGTVTATGREPADPVTAGVLRAVRDAGGSTSLAAVRHQGARCPEVQGIGHQLSAWGLLRPPGAAAQAGSSWKRLLTGFGAALAALLILAIVLREPAFLLGVVIVVMGFVFVAAGRAGELLVGGRQHAPRGHTRLGMRYVVQLRRQAALRSRLDGTVAGGVGLGEIAVLGLARLTDYALLDVFRQQQVAAMTQPQNTVTTSASSSCAAYYAAASPSWCGSSSCADSSFRGTSCSGPNSGGWSCASGGGSSCGGGGGSSCGGSSGGSSCGGGGGGGGCGGGGGS